jgi:adenylate cyclase
LNSHPLASPQPAALAFPTPLRPLVAVLPFTPVTDDPSLRLLGGEIADTLRDRLQRDPALQAILISSDFLSRAPPHALELVCRELRVGYLVSGKCHPNGREPSLYLELTETYDWHIRWAEFYRGQARTLLAPDAEPMSDLLTVLRRMLVERRTR